MKSSHLSPVPEFVDTLPQAHAADGATERDALCSALLAARVELSPKYFYDELGSALFDAITALDEYYPTRTERAIMQAHEAEIARAVHAAIAGELTLIDLGAGSCAKAAALFASLAPKRYVPIDISADYLRSAVNALQSRYPRIEMTGIAMDFSSALALPATLPKDGRLCFYPGSSIGNFTPEDALDLLKSIRAQSSGLLIGIDAVKDAATLELAYDDPLGVTGAFNLNMLRHLNRLIDADFNLREWCHVGLFNRELSRIEMHLQARSELRVQFQNASGQTLSRSFKAGERLHTENSYKYTPEHFSALLLQAGFKQVQRFTDPREWFNVFLAS